MGARAKRRRGRPNKPPRTISGVVPAQRDTASHDESPIAEWSDSRLEISILGPLEEFPIDEIGSRRTMPVAIPVVRECERESFVPIDKILRRLPAANDAAPSPSARETVPTHIVPTRRALAHDPRNTTLPVAPRPELLAACRPAPARSHARVAAAVVIALVSLATLAAARWHRVARTPTRAATTIGNDDSRTR